MHTVHVSPEAHDVCNRKLWRANLQEYSQSKADRHAEKEGAIVDASGMGNWKGLLLQGPSVLLGLVWAVAALGCCTGPKSRMALSSMGPSVSVHEAEEMVQGAVIWAIWGSWPCHHCPFNAMRTETTYLTLLRNRVFPHSSNQHNGGHLNGLQRGLN